METSKLAFAVIKLRTRGQVTLPKTLREALHLNTGDSLRAIKIANAIALTPLRTELEQSRKQMHKAMKQHGVGTEELLRDL